MKKISYNSPFVLTYFFISLAVLLVSLSAPSILRSFSVYSSPITSPATYFRLFSHALGHADVMHFTSNFLIILLVGPLLEEKYGTRNILILSLATAAITGLVHVIFSSGALLGASGVAFAYILLTSFSSRQEGKIPLTLILVALLYLGKEVYDIFTVESNVSNSTHLLGGVVGIIGGFTMKPGRNHK